MCCTSVSTRRLICNRNNYHENNNIATFNYLKCAANIIFHQKPILNNSHLYLGTAKFLVAKTNED